MKLFKRGSKWNVRFRVNGKDFWRATGTTNRKLAEQRKAQLILEIAQGRFGLMDEGKKKTFKDMVEKYMTEEAIKKAPKSKLRDEVSLKHLLPKFGNKYLAQITPSYISGYVSQRRSEKASASSINKELAFSKHAYNLAIRRWEWVSDNPFTRISMEKLPQQRIRYLTREEFDRLYQAANDRLKPIILFAVNTGVRQDNILSLKWDSIDLHRGVFTLPHTKNGERLGLPMNKTVKELLTELNKVRHINGDYVFSSKVGTKLDASKVDKWFRQALKTAGITDFRFHDLRHTFASWLSQGDVNIYKVQRLLGHRTIAMTMRYAHLSPQNLQDSVAVLDNQNEVVAKTVAV